MSGILFFIFASCERLNHTSFNISYYSGSVKILWKSPLQCFTYLLPISTDCNIALLHTNFLDMWINELDKSKCGFLCYICYEAGVLNPGGFLSPKSYVDVPAGPRKSDYLYTNFLPNFPPISIPFSKEKHPIWIKLGAFYNNLPKIHPIYVIWAPSSLMKTPRSLYQISRKSAPKGRHIYVYHVNVRTPPPFSILYPGGSWRAKESLKTDAQGPNKHHFPCFLCILKLTKGQTWRDSQGRKAGWTVV